jgi:uncharacterized alkaline shock family protein YloU
VTTPAAVQHRELAGHNRISTQALTSVAQAAAAQSFGVPAAQVRVSWADDAGALALTLATPISAPSLETVRADPSRLDAFGGGVLQRSIAAKAHILGIVERITGSRLSSVDIRITGILASKGGRVQ